jgi:hypothetical protein
MKTKSIISLVILLVAVGLAYGQRLENAGEKKELEGMGLCVKCSLKESDTCQTALQVEEDGRKVTYYFAPNNVSKLFHEAICKAPHKIKVLGRTRDVNGKKELTAARVELID